MKAQGRVGDVAMAPADAHGCVACPHPVIGPAILGSPDVLVNNLPALRMGDQGIHAACCGANTWQAASGAPAVLINNRPAFRANDPTKHCGGSGRLLCGSSNVFVGDRCGAASTSIISAKSSDTKTPVDDKKKDGAFEQLGKEALEVGKDFLKDRDIGDLIGGLAGLGAGFGLESAFDKIPISDQFKKYLKKATIPELKALAKTFFGALAKGRLPSAEELKKVATETVGPAVGGVLGAAVRDALPDEWPDYIKDGLRDLVSKGTSGAITTLIEDPSKMGTWAKGFAGDVEEVFISGLGRFAKDEVADMLPDPKSLSGLKNPVVKYLPDAAEAVVKEGLPILLGKAGI